MSEKSNQSVLLKCHQIKIMAKSWDRGKSWPPCPGLWQARSQGGNQEYNFWGKQGREKGWYLPYLRAEEAGSTANRQLHDALCWLLHDLALVRALTDRGRSFLLLSPSPLPTTASEKVFSPWRSLKGIQNIFNNALLLDFCVNNLCYL